MKRPFWRIVPLLLLALCLAACTAEPEPIPSQVPTTAPEAAQQEPTEAAPTSEPPTATPLPPSATAEPATATPESPAPEPELLPAEPVEVPFQASDGQELIGRYYPAAANSAPVIVLMHWAPGDQQDWVEIAYWLQNRGLGAKSPAGDVPWLDPSWFPAMLEGQSLAIFTFTFRNCEGGCASFERELWLLDARAAMETAAGLDGIDPGRMVAIGASIGADGAPDGCGLHNQDGGGCLGAFSLSPGSYLTMLYADAVSALVDQETPRPVWCLYAVGDSASAEACQSAEGADYRTVEYEGGGHGMELVDPAVEPNALQLMLDFIQLVLEL